MAARFGVADALDAGGFTAEEMAERTGTHPPCGDCCAHCPITGWSGRPLTADAPSRPWAGRFAPMIPHSMQHWTILQATPDAADILVNNNEQVLTAPRPSTPSCSRERV